MSETIMKIYASQDWVNENTVQSDWSMNDENDLSHIKGRTHYVSREVTEIIPETTFEASSDSRTMYSLVTLKHPVINEKYIVLFDGVEYDVLTVSNEDISNTAFPVNTAVFGNPFFLFDKFTDLGDYPFAIFYFIQDDGDHAYIYAESGEHTVQVIQCNETVTQLNEKFIPDTIARTSDIPSDDYINSLIDAKLAEIPIAEEAEF